MDADSRADVDPGAHMDAGTHVDAGSRTCRDCSTGTNPLADVGTQGDANGGSHGGAGGGHAGDTYARALDARTNSGSHAPAHPSRPQGIRDLQ